MDEAVAYLVVMQPDGKVLVAEVVGAPLVPVLGASVFVGNIPQVASLLHAKLETSGGVRH